LLAIKFNQPLKKYINDCEDNLHLIDSFIDGDLFGPEKKHSIDKKDVQAVRDDLLKNATYCTNNKKWRDCAYSS